MSSLVYHFTDTGRLPWILLGGVLKPGRNWIGGYPDPDFLWATTSPAGDRTASGGAEGFRSGLTRLVRFTLRADDFDAWPQAVAPFAAWTAEQVGRLEAAAKGKSRPQDWRCRAEALPTEAWVGIDTRSYTDPIWRPLDLTVEPAVFDPNTIGVWIGEKVYVSTQCDGPDGSTGYRVQVGTRGGSE